MAHQVVLHNGSRAFTTLSNFSNEETFATGSERKWNRVILLVHGFPDDHTTYNDIWPHLERAFDSKALLLAPLLRGYEESSQGPMNEYAANDLAGDIRAWINNIDHSAVPVNVLAHDWGSIATYRAVELYPNLITSVVTLAIPHFWSIPKLQLTTVLPWQLYLSSYMITMQFPSLYRHKFCSPSSDYLDSLWKYWSPGWDYTIQDIAPVKARLQVQSNLDNATAYYRCVLNIFNSSQYDNKIDFDATPLLSLGGALDGCMSSKLFDLAATNTHPNFGSRVLEGVGHFLHREDPAAVAAVVSNWFKEHD